MLYTISYILYGRMMGTVQNLASFLLLLLLLLIVIYDGVGMYNETIVMAWCVDDDDVDAGLCQPTCQICYHVRAHPFPQG